MFVVVFASNKILSDKALLLWRGGIKRAIAKHDVKRTVLYACGPIMGGSYCLAGFIGVIVRPFDEERCGSSGDVDYLQQFVYTTLFPVGTLMGLFHIPMFAARYGTKLTGAMDKNEKGELKGQTIGNAGVIMSCSMAQLWWLIIYFTWFRSVLEECKSKAADAPILSMLILSGFATGIILSIMCARIVISLRACASTTPTIDEFDWIYCGRDKDASASAYAVESNAKEAPADAECDAAAKSAPHAPRSGFCPFLGRRASQKVAPESRFSDT